jgi:hypothetical protein
MIPQLAKMSAWKATQCAFFHVAKRIDPVRFDLTPNATGEEGRKESPPVTQWQVFDSVKGGVRLWAKPNCNTSRPDSQAHNF